MRHDIESALVGCALRDGSVVGSTGIECRHFDGELARMVWHACGQLHRDGVVPDTVSVSDFVERTWGRRVMPEVGRLVQGAPSPKNAGHYAQLLREEHARGRLDKLALKLTDGRTSMEKVEEATRELAAIIGDRTERSDKAISEFLPAVVDSMSEGEHSSRVFTGFVDIDKKLGGLHGGDLIVVAARPAMGKTAFIINLIRNASEKGCRVGFISGEQGGVQVAQRLLAVRGDVSLAKMRARNLDDRDWTKINDAMRVVRGMSVWLDDRPRPRMADIAITARMWKHSRGLDLLCVDYLQLVRSDGADMRLQVGETAQGLKQIARELDIPVVVLAQVKRDVEDRPLREDKMGRMPWMGDIAESGLVEQAADQVMTLYRPDAYDPNWDGIAGAAYLNVAKNRHGQTGVVPLTWRPHSLRFENAVVGGVF